MMIENKKNNPEEFIKWEINKIIKEQDLKEILKLGYPNLEYTRDLLPERNEDKEILKIKEVQGLGIYLYYSSKGKIIFHEYILGIILKKLKHMKIKYKKGKTNYGEDFKIMDYRIELEVNANPSKQLYKRTDLQRRVKRHIENTILILLNQKDKEQYRKYYKEIIYKNNRIFTIPEFLDWIKKEYHK